MKIQEKKGNLKIKSPSLLTGYFDLKTKTFKDPKDSKGWFELEDKGEKKGKNLLIKGRKDEKIKILGEMVNLQTLSQILEQISFPMRGDFRLVTNPHKRQGFQLNLLTSSFHRDEITLILKQFNQQVLPFEQIKRVYYVSKIDKNSLFKVRQKRLREFIGL